MIDQTSNLFKRIEVANKEAELWNMYACVSREEIDKIPAYSEKKSIDGLDGIDGL
jgi:hypothetical protein